jgi:hypothetical protein
MRAAVTLQRSVNAEPAAWERRRGEVKKRLKARGSDRLTDSTTVACRLKSWLGVG